jgi:hypothetical protein
MADQSKDTPLTRRCRSSLRSRLSITAATLIGAGAVTLLGGCVSVPARGDSSVFAQGHGSATSAAVLPGPQVAQAMRRSAQNQRDANPPVNSTAVLGGLGAMSHADAWAMNTRRDDSLGMPGVHQAAGTWPQLEGASLLAPRRIQFQIDAGTVTVFDRAPASRRGRIHPRIY